MHIERAASIDKVAAVEVHGRVNVGAVGDGGQVLLCAMLMLAMLGVFQNGVRLCSCGKKKGLKIPLEKNMRMHVHRVRGT